MSRDNVNEFGDLLARVEKTIDDAKREEASGWLVVVIDTYPPEGPISAYGPFDSPEEALVQAGYFDASPHTGTKPADGSEPWEHVVVPLYPPVGEDGAK